MGGWDINNGNTNSTKTNDGSKEQYGLLVQKQNNKKDNNDEG